MKRMLYLVSALALLAACNDRSAATNDEVEQPDTGGGAGSDGGPTASLGDVDSGTLEDGVVTVVVALDGEDAIQEYALTGNVNGYARYDQQETPINRAFTAIAGSSSEENELVAIVTMDGGQFNRFFGGAVLEQGDFSAPASGFSYYSGNYAGLVNVGSPLPPGGGAPDAVTPFGVGEVVGSVYLIADFTDNATEGTIYGRQVDIGNSFQDLEDVVLIATDIAADGTFNGSVELGDLTGVGTYSGAFGGDDATYVGGIVALGDGAYVDIFEEGVDTSNLQEYGLFVIGQCEPASCFSAP
jgi:hypothetical protein